MTEEITFCRGGGCTAKLGPDLLSHVLSKIPKGLRKKIVGAAEPKKITCGFAENGYSFEIEGYVEKEDECQLWFTSSVERNPRKPKKEYSAQLRGEAYVTAYA